MSDSITGGSTYSHTSTGTPHATHPPTQPLLDRHMVDNSVNAPQQWNSGAHPNYGAVGSYGGFVGQSSPLDQGGHPSVYTAEPGNRAPEPGNQNHMYQRQQHRDIRLVGGVPVEVPRPDPTSLQPYQDYPPAPPTPHPAPGALPTYLHPNSLPDHHYAQYPVVTQPVQPAQYQAVQAVQPAQYHVVQPVQPVQYQVVEPVQPPQYQAAVVTQPVQPVVNVQTLPIFPTGGQYTKYKFDGNFYRNQLFISALFLLCGVMSLNITILPCAVFACINAIKAADANKENRTEDAEKSHRRAKYCNSVTLVLCAVEIVMVTSITIAVENVIRQQYG